MGQRYTALNREGRSDFRKLGHQGECSIFTEVTVRHPRRKMALDSPEFAHMNHSPIHTPHKLMCKLIPETRETHMYTTWQASDPSSLDSTSQDPFRAPGA